MGTGVGMGTGWVRGGVIPSPPTLLEEGPEADSDRRERALPAGEGGLRARTSRLPGPPTPGPRAFRGPLRCPGTLPRANAASGPIRAIFWSYSSKVSQNRIVSPVFVEKA